MPTWRRSRAASIVTSSRTRGPIVRRPSAILTDFTERSSPPAEAASAAAGAFAAGFRAQRGEVPETGGILRQHDVRPLDGQARDVQLAGKDERHDLDAHVQRFRAQKGIAAKRRIVGDGQVGRGDAAGKQRQLEIADVSPARASAAESCDSSIGRKRLASTNKARARE